MKTLIASSYLLLTGNILKCVKWAAAMASQLAVAQTSGPSENDYVSL